MDAYIGTIAAPRVAMVCCLAEFGDIAKVGPSTVSQPPSTSSPGSLQREGFGDCSASASLEVAQEAVLNSSAGASSKMPREAVRTSRQAPGPSGGMIMGEPFYTSITAMSAMRLPGHDGDQRDGGAHLQAAPSADGSSSPAKSAEDDAAEAAGGLGRALWGVLLEDAFSDPELSKAKYAAGSSTHRKKVRLWQALCVLSRFVAEEQAPEVVQHLLRFLQVSNQPTVKMYAEAILVRILLRDPGLIMTHVDSVLQDYTKKAEGLPSFILVAAQVIRNSTPEWRERLKPMFVRLLPWTMTHHHAVRTFAQLAVHDLLQQFPDLFGRDTDPCVGALYRFLQDNADLERLRESMGASLTDFDPERATSPSGVFVTGSQLVGPQGTSLEGAPPALMDRVVEFVTAARKAAGAEKSCTSSAMGFTGGGKETGKDTGELFQRKGPRLEPGSLLSGSQGRVSAALDTLLGHEAPGPESPLDGKSEEGRGAARHQLIVVATFLDRVPNLAGLARGLAKFLEAAPWWCRTYVS
eukprot:jgi/Botrbrau1/1894/Bobra.0005s0010.1